MAGPTRLELATSGVTGRRSNQLNYDPAMGWPIIEKRGSGFKFRGWLMIEEAWIIIRSDTRFGLIRFPAWSILSVKDDALKLQPRVPKKPLFKPSGEGAPINIVLTRDKFYALLKVVYLGEYLANGFRTDDRIQEYLAIEQDLLVLAERSGLQDIVEYDAELKKFFPKCEFDEMMLAFVDDFEEESFWEELAYRLAVRDMIREFGEKGLKKMSRMRYAKKLFGRQDEYLLEEENYGLERLEVVQKGKG
jgi:hypothetical protein